jgi:hypothetical protein
LALALTLLTGFGGSSGPNATAASTPAALRADNLNLIFVVSEDLAYQAPGDLNPVTANLTNRGLQRSLRMAKFLRRHVLGRKNVTGIYVLEPMTHLQTTGNYPDMVAPETIQQFALLNHITLSSALPPEYFPYTGNSYPLNASYAPGSVPPGVAIPTSYCPNCQGLDFNDNEDNNETLVARKPIPVPNASRISDNAAATNAPAITAAQDTPDEYASLLSKVSANPS